jgi:hypothetical protein
MLSKENLAELRHNLAYLSLPAVRDRYEQAYRDCRLIADHLPSPRQMQTLVQMWKQEVAVRHRNISACIRQDERELKAARGEVRDLGEH